MKTTLLIAGDESGEAREGKMLKLQEPNCSKIRRNDDIYRR